MILHRLGQEGRAGSVGKGAGLGDKERFIQAKRNVEAHGLGHHNFAKGGSSKTRPWSLTKINQGPGGEDDGGDVYCFLTSSGNPSVPGAFESLDWHYMGSDW